MKRITLLYQLDLLLKNCKGCSHNSENGTPEVRCNGCSFYPQIRWVGNQLGRKKQMKLTLEEYQDYKAKGMSDADIAKKYDIKQPTLIYYKKQWKISSKQADTATIEQKECTCKGKENNARYEQEISELKQELTARQNECNLWYEESKKHESNCNHLDNLYKQQTEVVCRLKESKNDLQWEFDQLKKKEYKDSYVIEGQKKRIEDLGKTLVLYERENKAMRELLAIWI